jgi:hypothetical protein
MLAPVIQRAASEARKVTTSATSGGSPTRPIAIVEITAGLIRGAASNQAPMSVSNDTRCDGVDGDLVRNKGVREGAAEDLDGCLVHGVVRERAGNPCHGRRQIDNASAVAHACNRSLRDEERCPDVDRATVVEGCRGDLIERRGIEYSGVVDEHVERLSVQGGVKVIEESIAARVSFAASSLVP